jgi:UDP-sulfoquinovose synthase
MDREIIIFGGDGFCGWPTALHLSKRGYKVTIVDNLSRRNIDIELEVQSLTPIMPIGKRIEVWKGITGNTIEFYNIDISEDYCSLLSLMKDKKPHSVIHFAEQRAAPYSMKSSWHKRYTVTNNINATNNIMCSIIDSKLDTHVIHLGSMGVYGYGTVDMKIPEGYLNVVIKNDNGKEVCQEILYPANPGSIYHLTKTQDQLTLAYYNKNDEIRVTDLHQGVVWGTQTDETELDERLINRFDYDGDYGTVLNRFIMQAAVDYPLTVYGKGGQTRAFIHIADTVKCIELAIKNPPKIGEKVKVMNQMTETHTVGDLAKMVSECTGATIQYIKNPRNEDDYNVLHVECSSLINLGLEPTYLKTGLMKEIEDIVYKYSNRINFDKILCTSLWK